MPAPNDKAQPPGGAGNPRNAGRLLVCCSRPESLGRQPGPLRWVLGSIGGAEFLTKPLCPQATDNKPLLCVA